MSRTDLVRVACAVLIVALIALRIWVARSRTRKVGTHEGTDVLVRRRGRFRELVLARGNDELVQSRQDVRNPLSAGEGYVDHLMIGMRANEAAQRVLFLGGGAAIAPRQVAAAYPEVSIDIVENNPVVVKAANRYFGFRETSRMKLHLADARAFVAGAAEASYDVVVLDVYDERGVPPELVTSEFFASLRCCVADGGAVVVNLANTVTLDEDAIRDSLASAFADSEITRFPIPPFNTLLLIKR